MIKNSIRAIEPYIWNGLWVFDDPIVKLSREAFIGGADLVMDALSMGSSRFTLLFSDQQFPGHQLHLKLRSVEQVGQTYITDDGKEAWLCPALLLYFEEPPKHLYGQATNHSKHRMKRKQGSRPRADHPWRQYEQHFSRIP